MDWNVFYQETITQLELATKDLKNTTVFDEAWLQEFQQDMDYLKSNAKLIVANHP